jgi:hypothetical protein
MNCKTWPTHVNDSAKQKEKNAGCGEIIASEETIGI